MSSTHCNIVWASRSAHSHTRTLLGLPLSLCFRLHLMCQNRALCRRCLVWVRTGAVCFTKKVTRARKLHASDLLVHSTPTI